MKFSPCTADAVSRVLQVSGYVPRGPRKVGRYEAVKKIEAKLESLRSWLYTHTLVLDTSARYNPHPIHKKA